MMLKIIFRLLNSLLKILVTPQYFDADTFKTEVDLSIQTLSDQKYISKSYLMTHECSTNAKPSSIPFLGYTAQDLCVGSASVSCLRPRICQMHLPCLLLSFDSSWKFDHVSKIIQFDHIISILFIFSFLEKENN